MVNCHQHSMGGGERRRKGTGKQEQGGKDGEEKEEGNEEEEEEEEIFFSVAILNVKSENIPKRDKQGNTCKILSMHPSSRNYHKRLTQEYLKSAENILNTKIFYAKMAIIEK